MGDGDFGARTGVGRVLKPLLNFEELFEGEPAVTFQDSGGTNHTSEKIPFFEWKGGLPPNPRDSFAASGAVGYDPNLLNYIDVAKGSTLRFYFPLLYPFGSGFGAGMPAFYRYFILFRDSNLARYKAQAEGKSSGGDVTPYHLPFETFGAPDTTAPPGAQDRFLMPAGGHSVAVHEPEPPRFDPAKVPGSTGGTGQLVDGNANALSLRTECVIPRPEIVNGCLIAAGVRGAHQQGVIDPSAFNPPSLASAAACGGMYFECLAHGDQLLICCDREYTGLEVGTGPNNSNSPNWSFAGADWLFSNIYGVGVAPFVVHAVIPETGIYLWETTNQ